MHAPLGGMLPQPAGIHLEKSPRGGKSTSEDILGGHAYSGQYSILKGCNSQGGGANAPPPPPPLNETLRQVIFEIYIL